MTTIYLIDGSGYIFRAFYAIRHLSRSDGLPTNALYGYTTMLWKFLREVQPTHAAVVCDAKEPSFREVRCPEYKANRKAPPDELIPQFPLFPQATQALGLPQFVQPGFEADDILGTLARRFAAQGHDVVILTGDKDLMQLVDERISLWEPMKDKRIGFAEVRERFGVLPTQVVDVLALAGDASDNIKGVPGIGEKTASKLIGQFGSLEALLERAAEVPGKVGESLRAHRAAAELAQWLAQIDCAMDVPATLDDLRLAPFDRDALRAWCRDMEFTRLLADLGPAHVPGASTEAVTTTASDATALPVALAPTPVYHTILTREALTQLIADIRAAGACAFDTETIGLDPQAAELVGISLAWGEGLAAYIPLQHHYLGVPEQLPLATVQELLAPLLADAALPKDCHHANFDLPILRRYGLPVAGLRHDTLLVAFVLDPAPPHGLDALALRHVRHAMLSYADVVGKGKGALANFSEVPVERATHYAAEDADMTGRLVQCLVPQLWDAAAAHYARFERPLIDVLCTMEAHGILVDRAQLDAMAVELRAQLQQIEADIYELSGVRFNIASPKQLGDVLFDKLQLPGGKKTKTGFSTDAGVLESLASQHPVPAKILDYRQLAKLLSTYVEALPAMINARTGRVHTMFHQHGAATGRLSSSDPNLQNIPIRSTAGKRIREAFIAAPGHVLLSADYSQIELRVLAHVTREPGLIAAFCENRDIHAQTAAALFEVAPDQITSDQRSIGKTINFSVIYGQSAFGLANQLHIPQRDAATYIERYLAQYPAIAAYREQVLRDAQRDGWVTTLYGHRRRVTDLGAKQQHVRGNAERMAFNTVIQGTAAEIMKLAMLAVDRAIAESGIAMKMLLQVHDELVCEVAESAVAEATLLVRTAMEQVAAPDGPFAVPLTVGISTGANWAVCK